MSDTFSNEANNLFDGLSNILTTNYKDLSSEDKPYPLLNIKRDIHDEKKNILFHKDKTYVILSGLIYLLDENTEINEDFFNENSPIKNLNDKNIDFFDLLTYISEDNTLEDFVDLGKVIRGLMAIYKIETNKKLNISPNILQRCNNEKPENLYIPTSKLTRNLNTIIDAGMRGVSLNVASSESQQPMHTNCIISFDDDKTNLSKKTTPFDTLVYNAIATYAEHFGADKLITLENIYRIMVGDSGSATPSKQQVEKIKQSIDKMRVYTIKIDCTDEVTAYKKSHLAEECDQLRENKEGKFFFDTYLLACEWISAVSNRNEITALHLLRKPVMLEYSKISGQILNIPSYLLDTKHIQQNTERNLILKDYLLRRIEGMKGNNNLNQNIISLHSYQKNGKYKQGLYEQVMQQDEISRKDSEILRKAAVKYLDYWKECNYIKDYQFEKKGRAVSGIRIEL